VIRGEAVAAALGSEARIGEAAKASMKQIYTLLFANVFFGDVRVETPEMIVTIFS
jgi:hypothetical protein